MNDLVPRRRILLATLLFLFGFATMTLPILIPAHLQTQDGGAHYNTGMTLAGMTSNSKPFFERYFERRENPLTNQLASTLIAEIIRFGFPQNAERLVWMAIFIVACGVIVINFWIIRKGLLVGSLLLFPIFDGEVVNLGFINYIFGLILFVQGVFLLRFGFRRPSIPWLFGLLVLSTIIYVMHPISALAFAATCGSLAVAYVINWQVGRWRNDTRGSHAIAFPIGCSLACALIAALAVHDSWPQVIRLLTAVSHVDRNALPQSPIMSVADTFRERIIFVFGLSYLVSYSPRDYWFSLIFQTEIVWLCAICFSKHLRRRRWRVEDTWILPAATLVTLEVIIPRTYESFMPERIAPCLLTVLVVWLAEVDLDRSSSRVLTALALSLNIGVFFSRLQWASSIDTILSEYASIALNIPDGSSVLSVESGPSHLQMQCRAVRPRQLPCNFRPTLHFVGEIIGKRPVALLNNYQLRPQAGFFPLALRGGWSSYTNIIEDFERWPPPPTEIQRISEIVARVIARQPPDIIITWDEQLATGGKVSLDHDTLRPIINDYVKIFTSRPLGAASVYAKITLKNR